MYAVFDVGGTHARLGLSQDGRTLDAVEKFDSDAGKGGFEAFANRLHNFVRQQDVQIVAGGLPGQVERESGELVLVPHLPGWEGTRPQQYLEELLKVPVCVENDAAVAGLGEAVYGAGKGSSIVAYMTVSTGINGVRIVRGQIEPSAYGFEIGKQLVESDRQVVPLESVCGGAELAAKYGVEPKRLDPQIWETEARYLAQGLFNTLLHWSPDVVVLGGSMMHDIAVSAIERELKKLPYPYKSWPVLKLSQLGDDAGLWGGIALCNLQQKVNYSPTAL